MQIALSGYGKMNRLIERLALSQGHEVVLRADSRNPITVESIRGADVVIDFSTPQSAPGNIRTCIRAGVPIVVGTTGWQQHLPELTSECERAGGAMIHASNFSIGVNVLFALNKILAEWIAPYPQYEPTIHEVHHVHKLDHPSGTALTLANDLLEKFPRKKAIQSQELGAGNSVPSSERLLINWKRKEEVTGEHSICYASPVDTITLSHSAKNREGFALGALMAAKFISSRKGVFTASDLFNFKISE